MGFNLYNVGFTAGIVGTSIVALYKSYGFVPEPVMLWTSGNNKTLATFLLLLLISMLLGFDLLTLAPIAGRFGWHWGIVAGFVHSSAALSVGSVHAELKLYNNGFAAGIVAAVLVPVIIAVTKRGTGVNQH